MRRLSPEDRNILALESEAVAGHTCKLVLVGGSIDGEELRCSIGERLLRAPELAVRLEEIDGEPCWVSDPELDLAAHVTLSDGDADGLPTAVARLFEQRLDRSRPLWRIDVIPRPREGDTALVWRIHHALADGSTAMRIAGAVLWDEQPDARPPAHVAVHRRAHERLGGLRTAAREAPQPWLRSPFSGRIGGRRAVGFASIELGGLHRVAHAAEGATVNDAVLAVVAGGLRRWLEARHGHLGDAVRVKVPVSLHDARPAGADPSGEPGNRDSFFCVDLPLGIADPLERLDAVRRATRVRKDGHDAEHLDALMHQLGRVPALREFAGRVLANPRSFALNVSNVRGPGRPIHVLGVPVRALYSLAEIREHHALRIAVVSFAGTLRFGLTADATLLPDVGRLAHEIETEAASMIAMQEDSNGRSPEARV